MATELPEINVTADEPPPEKPVDTGPNMVVAQEGPVTAVAGGEPIRAQSSDGMTHEFPAGTDQAVVDKAMKSYAQEHADKTSTVGQMGRGFMDPVEGGGQLVSNLLPESVRSTLDTFNNWAAKHTGGLIRELPPGGKNQQMQEREAAIQQERGANKDNIDWSRMGGDLLNPVNYIGGGGVGGASKLLNVGRAGLAGGVAGAISPSSDPDYWREKQKQVVLGSVFGLGVGTAASAAGQGLDAIGAYIARNKPEALENEVVKKIVKRIAQDQKAGGPSAQDMIDLVNAGDKPRTLTDVGGANVKGLAGNVARQPGESRAIASQLIGPRDEAAAQRISKDIETYMHGGPTSYQTNEMLLAARSAASTPAYKEAYALKNIWSPRLQQFIDDPDFQKGLTRGWHLERLRALAEGRKITATELGVDLDMEGNAKLISVPNMRLLDMAKRGMDAMIADTRDPITGRLSAHGVALNQARHAFVRELEDLDTSGAYRRARAAWEGPSASRDAVQLGRAVFQHSPEEMAAEVARLSPANREFGRIGVADILKERLSKTGLSGDEAKAIIKNPWMRNQLRPWFRSSTDFDRFTDAIATETQMFETGRKVLGGSQTAERVAEDSSVENAFSATKILRDATEGRLLRAAADAWRLYRDLGKGDDSIFNEKIAQILFATQIPSEMADKLTGKAALGVTNPLAKTGAAVSAGGVPAGAALSVPQAQNRGNLQPPPAPQQNPVGGNQIPGRQSSLQQGGMMSDASPDPMRPGAQYAENAPQQAKPSASGGRENLLAADKEMHLTPQEKALYEMHLKNLNGPGGVDNANGSRSSLLQATVETDDKAYSIPTVWDGKIHTADEAWEHWKGQIDQFPSYATEDEAEARYQKMHEYMDRDTEAYQRGNSKNESVLPREESNFLSDAEQAAEARGAAASRHREAVKPTGGRQESEATESMLDLIPGRGVVRSLAQGEYGEAAVQAGMSALPYGGKALGAAARAFPAVTKTVGAAIGALTGLLTGSEAGKIPLSPEQRQRLQMEQQSLKQKQDASIADAKLRTQEAEDKAKRDIESANQAAKTQADLQERLARIEAEKEQKKAEIEAKRHKEDEDAAQRSLDAAKAEAKRMAERPFREKYPSAALGLTMGGMAVAAMLPVLSNQQKASAINKYIKEWEKLDKAAADALKSGTAEEKSIAVQRLSDASNKWVETKDRLSKPDPVSKKLAVGLAGAEGAALPAEIDFGLQPKDSEAHKSAEEFFTNPMEMARVVATYLGGTMAGMTASKYPFKTAEPPVGSGGLLKAYEQQQANEKKAASLEKRAKTLAAKKAAEKPPERSSKGEEKETRKARVPKALLEVERRLREQQ